MELAEHQIHEEGAQAQALVPDAHNGILRTGFALWRLMRFSFSAQVYLRLQCLSNTCRPEQVRPWKGAGWKDVEFSVPASMLPKGAGGPTQVDVEPA